MSVREKSSVYEQPSVYNQGGGGSSFDVDIGGGISQTFVFPQYLQPVEYISLENYTANNFSLLGCSQVQAAQDYYFKTKFSVNYNKMGNDYEVPFDFAPAYHHNDNHEIRISVNYLKYIIVGFGSANIQFSSLDYDKTMIVEVDCPHNLFKLSYADGSNSFSRTDTRNKGTRNMGQWTFFNYFQTTAAQTFHGKIYYTYLKQGNSAKALWVPARSKDANDKKPYIVECVAGSVGVNCSENASITGIEFGPDIDLSDIGNYFQ